MTLVTVLPSAWVFLNIVVVADAETFMRILTTATPAIRHIGRIAV